MNNKNEKLYLVTTDDDYYKIIVKANNKKDAIGFMYDDFLVDNEYHKNEIKAVEINKLLDDNEKYCIL